MNTKLALATALIIGGSALTAGVSEARDGYRHGGARIGAVIQTQRGPAIADYRGHRNHAGPRYGAPVFHRCVAVARTAGGNGHVIPGIRGVAGGPGACAVAMRECRSQLGFRKWHGRNPFAQCVVAHNI
ncbi:MAG TPA: hypothetical protein VMX97_15795 [Hyphomicrobiaceae bacterium]|nr:hypothetical protein [Hyphomicrobiaceae bacterium]